MGKIIILSGPSGAGKTTLYEELLSRNPNLKKIISVTTRPRREGEINGRDYFFVSSDMFRYKKSAGHFLETEKVFGNCYGTPASQVKKVLANGNNVLLCIDVKGAKKIIRKFPGAIRIFVKTPSLRVLRKRLLGRASEGPADLKLRVEVAKNELKEAAKYDHIIVNSDLAKAKRDLLAIAKKILD